MSSLDPNYHCKMASTVLGKVVVTALGVLDSSSKLKGKESRSHYHALHLINKLISEYSTLHKLHCVSNTYLIIVLIYLYLYLNYNGTPKADATRKATNLPV